MKSMRTVTNFWFYLLEQLILDNTMIESDRETIFSGSFAADENILSVRKTSLTQS